MALSREITQETDFGGKDEPQSGHAELDIQAINPGAAHSLYLVFEGEIWTPVYIKLKTKIIGLNKII